MTRPLFRRVLRAVFACGLGVMMTTATPTAVPAMSAVAEHMHRDHPGEEQHPNPVLRKPFHDWLLYCIRLSIGDFTDRCTLLAVADAN